MNTPLDLAGSYAAHQLCLLPQDEHQLQIVSAASAVAGSCLLAW